MMSQVMSIYNNDYSVKDIQHIIYSGDLLLKHPIHVYDINNLN